VQINQQAIFSQQLTKGNTGYPAPQEVIMAADWWAKHRPLADGTYTVVGVTHQGDTRGNDWQTRFETWGVDPSKLPVGLGPGA
jgi:hypothetical protein